MTVLQMAGSDIYCSIAKGRTRGTRVGPWRNGVVCFHAPDGPHSDPKGYVIVAFDSSVAVESSGTLTVRKLLTQPALSKYPVHEGGIEYPNVVSLDMGDAALVSDTHMAIVVVSAKGGGKAIGVICTDARGYLIVGTEIIGISNHFVTIAKATGAHASKIIYSHSVY